MLNTGTQSEVSADAHFYCERPAVAHYHRKQCDRKGIIYGVNLGFLCLDNQFFPLRKKGVIAFTLASAAALSSMHHHHHQAAVEDITQKIKLRH